LCREARVISDCFGAFSARENAAETGFRKIENGENRGEKVKNLENFEIRQLQKKNPATHTHLLLEHGNLI